MLPKASLASIINEEISLEGLEGSTLNSLWNHIAVRLEMTMPLPQKLMDTIWAKVLRNPNFEFYLLQAERKPYVWFDRLAHVDPDTGIPVHPPEFPGHRFKYKPIEANGIRGSCEEYDTRTPIPREELLPISFQEVEEKYGLKFAIVASQRLRESFLMNQNCTVELTIMQYCMLEWIGRSRFNGETSHGKFSLLEVTGDSSSLFYYRKALCNGRLITRQNLSIRSEDVSIQGIVFHLPRYYTEMKSKQLLIAERVVSELKRRKHYVADYEEMKMIMLGRADAGKLFRSPEFQRYIKTDEMVPYREIYPDAPVSAWQSKRGDEKLLRIMRLIDPNADVQDREGPEETEAKDGFMAGADSSMLYVDLSLARQAYQTVAASGDTGISQSEMATKLELDRLNSRSVLKHLIRLKIVESQSVDEGRQRTAKFFLAGARQPKTSLSSAYDKELVQFISNQKEVIEIHRQQQSSREAEELFQNSLSQLLPVADSLVDSYQTMFNNATNRTDGGGDIVLPLDAFNTSAQDNIVTSVILSDKLHRQKIQPGISDSTKSKAVSMLVLRRCNFIVNLVKQEHAIEPRAIVKKLVSEERVIGHRFEACNKSVMRLISQLAADRLVVIANVTMKRDEREFCHVYVCDPKITLDLSALQSKVNIAKVGLALQSKARITGEHQLKRDAVLRENSGCLPKCLRMKLLHEFLYYLVYEHKADARELAVNELRTVDLDGLDGHELSPIYSDTNDWKMFVPPIGLKYESYGNGWVLLADVLVRMPLGIFCSIGAFAFYSNELDYYLDHPIRRYFLIKNLPEAIQEQLFAKRRYIYAILVSVKLLCYAGLLQMGPQLAKVLDQTMIYVNSSTALLDTTSSPAGYNEIEDREYPLLPFRFDRVADVKEYWRKLYEVATGTHLNSRSTAIGKEILVQNINFKPAMQDAVREQTAETALANDCGQLPPGDRKGAAGMDTALFMHLRSNWHKMMKFSMPIDRHRLKKLRKTVMAKKPGAKAGQAADKKKLTLKKVIRTSGPKGISIVSKVTGPGASRRLIKRRFIKAPKTVLRRAWSDGYDEVDQHALMQMNKLRVKWSPNEDHLMLLCRVALLYLYGSSKSACCPIHSAVYRDIMHWAAKDSHNKTSRACQRRLTYMVTKMPGYGDRVRTMLEECKLDPDIGARFGPNFVPKLRERFPNPETFSVAVRIHFVQLVRMVRDRFDRKQPAHGQVARGQSDGGRGAATRKLPNTLAEFYRLYNVTDPSVAVARLNYTADPVTVEELVRYKLTVVLHSAIVNRRYICDEQLHHILEPYTESSLKAAANLLRSFQLVSTTTKCSNGKMIITSASFASDRRIFHLSITYQQQLQTSFPFELFVPLFGQLATLVGRERYTEVPYECEDGGEGMALLLCELVAIGKVELSIDQATNYIEMRPDAVKGNSEVLQQLRDQGFTELLPGEPAQEETQPTLAPPPAKRPRKGQTASGEGEAAAVSKYRGQGFLEPRKSPASGKRAATRGASTGRGAAARSKCVQFATDKSVTFHYAMHPIERLAKLPVEYFHFFCLLEQLKAADRRSCWLLAQTFKIDELHPTSCFLAKCVVVCGPTGDADLVGRCLALVRGRETQLERIRKEGGSEKSTAARKMRLDAAQFFEVREDNLLLFFGKYIDAFQTRAGKKHKRDINRQQVQGLAKTTVNMVDLIVDCLALEDEGSNATEQHGWLERYEMTNTGATGDTTVVAFDDEDEDPGEGDGEDGRKGGDLLSTLSEKVFKLHNFYEVTTQKIHVQVRVPGGGDEVTQDIREAYGQWEIPRAFLPNGVRRRKEILHKVASDAVWLQSDQMAPLMTEAMTLIGRNQRARKLLEFIERKQALGATATELADAFPNHSQLEQHMRTLRSFKCVLRTGFHSVTYVHWRHTDTWFTRAPIAPSDETDHEQPVQLEPVEPVAGPSGRKRKGTPRNEEQPSDKRCKLDDRIDTNEKSDKYIQIAMAPWIKIDGTLDKRLLYRWLSAVLLYCVAHPGVPFSVLFKRFNMVSPFHLRQLLEILQDFGCVSLHSMQCAMKKTLFSVCKPAEIVPVSEFLPDDHTYIETPPSALSTLALCIGESRKYTQELYDPVRRMKRVSGAKEDLASQSTGEG
uniref:Uncharacterized protein n=1 Tax=Anopheles atroparvus TaxID=41427 RepID=A0A182JAE2_ANOAO